MEQIPFVPVFHNGVVGSPAYHRSQDYSLISERTVRIVADGVAQAVGITGRVGEVIFSVILVHPACFEETAFVVSGCQRLPVFVQDHYGFRFFGKLQHIRTEFGNASGDGRLVVCGESSSTFQSFVVAIALQLSAPQTTEVHVVVTVSIIQNGGVHAVTSAHRVGLGNERTFGTVADGNTDTEDIILVFQGEIHIIFAVFLSYVAIPELTSCPRNIFGGEYQAMVYDFTFHGVIGREDVVVFHIEMVTVVIFGDTAFPVVGRVDVKTVVEHMHGRVCHIISGYQVSFFFLHDSIILKVNILNLFHLIEKIVSA